MTIATLNDAAFNNRAFAAFDVIDLESADMVITTAESLSQPVVLMVPHKAFPVLPLERFIGRIRNWAESATVPVCVHLDHGETLEGARQGLDAGFSSIMIDASAETFDRNVELTRKACELARPYGVSVEAELGRVGGDEGNFDETSATQNIYTDADEAARFVEATGVDALAISFGTSHGLYQGEPKLNFDIVRAVKERTPVKLVMHGASGLPDHEYGKAAEAGIGKINMFTEISVTGATAANAAWDKRGGKLHFFEMLMSGKQAMAARTAHYMNLISAGNERRHG
ncbi:MAG: class II fructose-bisphosphate aldolase [Proteobacteria bacterium]|nr:class II fructose-bisphosphate aldolase [Pseudomonadota bacterium]